MFEGCWDIPSSYANRRCRSTRASFWLQYEHVGEKIFVPCQCSTNNPPGWVCQNVRLHVLKFCMSTCGGVCQTLILKPYSSSNERHLNHTQPISCYPQVVQQLQNLGPASSIALHGIQLNSAGSATVPWKILLDHRFPRSSLRFQVVLHLDNWLTPALAAVAPSHLLGPSFEFTGGPRE